MFMRIAVKLVNAKAFVDVWKLFAEAARKVSKADDIDFILRTAVITADLVSIEIHGFAHFWIGNIAMLHYFY